MDRVVDKDDILIAVYKIHHRLGGVAEKKIVFKKHCIMFHRFLSS